VVLAVWQLAIGPWCTGEWGWRQQNGEKQRGGATELGFDDSLRAMRMRVAGACGGRCSVGGWWLPVGTGCTVGFSAWRSARAREVGGWWPSGPGPFPTELSSALFKWAGRSQRAGTFSLVLLFTSLPNKFESSGFKNTNDFLT
jgi:hypothetical protein